MTDEPPGAPDRLARQRLDARLGHARRPPERPLHGARGPVPVDRARVGGPRRRADLRDPVRRPARHGRAARARGARLGARRVPRLDHGLGDDRGARPATSASCASTRWRCCRSAATTWATTSPTGSRSASATGAELPKIFLVNWFRKDDDGRFLWPGFGENSRVLAWVFRRCDDDAEAVDTPIGRLPTAGGVADGGPGRLARGTGGAACASTRGLGRPAAADARAPRQVRRPAAGQRSAASSRDWRTRSADDGRSGGPAVLHRPGGPAAAQG